MTVTSHPLPFREFFDPASQLDLAAAGDVVSLGLQGAYPLLG